MPTPVRDELAMLISQHREAIEEQIVRRAMQDMAARFNPVAMTEADEAELRGDIHVGIDELLA